MSKRSVLSRLWPAIASVALWSGCGNQTIQSTTTTDGTSPATDGGAADVTTTGDRGPLADAGHTTDMRTPTQDAQPDGPPADAKTETDGRVQKPDAACVPGPEICNGQDDNCDGRVDEGFDVGAACAVGAGACARPGTYACTPDGAAACVAEAGEAADVEICDGLDNNCDGQIDEGFGLGEPCGAGTGACAVEGVLTCGPQGDAVCSAQPTAPRPEVCNGVDDNCDGQVDNDVTDVDTPCPTGLPGPCAGGRTVCLDGVAVCASVIEPGDETCDGVDNDCNGLVDDAPDGRQLSQDCYDGPAATRDVGACHAGERLCTDGAFGACGGAVLPGVEQCNRADDNCDGAVDEGLDCICVPGAVEPCYTGPAGTVGQGRCRAGLWTCQADGRAFGACVGEAGPEPETCNGEDDDCNGAADDNVPGADQPCEVGTGACHAVGTFVCDAAEARLLCDTGGAGPQPETCNGVDDDCDGQVDEGLGVGDPCSAGIGACQAPGRLQCDGAGGLACDAVPGVPGIETCNGVDDNCDGVADEGFGVGDACAAGLGVCHRNGHTICDLSGHVGCDALAGDPTAETCNGLDDNCNGLVDDQPAGVGQACDTGLAGVCAAGTQSCEAGGLRCVPHVVPQVEACDGLDNDCNGLVDDGPGGGALVQDCYEGPAGTQGQGICVGGLRTCAAARFGACVGQVLPAATDVCDGVDNNCNGRVDDQVGGGNCACVAGTQRACYDAAAVTAGVGPCRMGTQTCAADGRSWGVCAGEVVPAAEICNGTDDNCDGQVDNVAGLFDGCLVGVGECAGLGFLVCDNRTGQLACSGSASPPTPEVCDGLDNDCNGAVDDVPQVGTACSAGEGACVRNGMLRCDAAGHSLTCSAAPGAPQAESCDGVDNNCDGVVDNGVAGTGQACASGLPGDCAAGVTACRGNGVACVATIAVGQNQERCDGRDNDCDGVVDDSPVDAGLPCTAGVGACMAAGLTVCQAPNQVVCNAHAGNPSAEICDGLDNNCNGQTDEGLNCAVYTSCLDAYVRGVHDSGVYTIRPGGAGTPSYSIYCDQFVDNGGWTLVGSALNATLTDARTDWHNDLTTLAPAGANEGIWDGLRGLADQFDLRFVCRDAPSAENAPMYVDLSFYRTSWYHRITSGTDADSCFVEGVTALPLAPSRRNNMTGAMLPRGNQYDYGYMEGEDTCDSADDFAVDFDDRGKDSLQSDGTDWGRDDNARKCGRSGLAGGQWFLFARERKRVAVVGPDLVAGLLAGGYEAEALPADANLPGKLTPETYETLFIGRLATGWGAVTDTLKTALLRFSVLGGNVVTEWDGAALFGQGYDPSFRYAAGAPAPLSFFRYNTGGGDVRGANTAVTAAGAGLTDPILTNVPNPLAAGTGTESFFTTVAVAGATTWLSPLATFPGNGTPSFPLGNLPAILRGRRCGGNFLAADFDWQDNANDPGVSQLLRNLAAESIRPPPSALEDTCREPLRPTVMVCGASVLDANTFIRGGSPLQIVASCAPDGNTQALLVTRAGLPQLNAATIQVYLAGGGIVITEQATSDEIWTWAFGQPQAQAGVRTGACHDNVQPLAQFSPRDPFWEENRFEAVPAADTGCGYDAAGFAGIVPLGGPAAGIVTLGYRDLAIRGRVWVVESDWSDGDARFTAQSAGLMHYMITHGPRPLTVSGIQTNLDPDPLARGGFEACWQGSYVDGRLLFDVLQACTQGTLMLVCRPQGATNWQLGAMAARADVVTDVGAGAAAVHNANGADWYYSTAASWGFAPAGAGVNRAPWDNAANLPDRRLSWVTTNNNLVGNGRCGASTGIVLGWERAILQRPGGL